MTGLGKYIIDFDKKKPAQVRLIIANRLEMKRRRIFQLDFGDPPSHTQCTTDFVNFWFPDKERKDFWSPMKIKSADAKDEEPFPAFDYGDSDSGEEESDGEGGLPLAVVRDHDCGDEPLEDKIRAYRMAKERQKKADESLIVTAKDMLELEAAASDEEFEF